MFPKGGNRLIPCPESLGAKVFHRVDSFVPYKPVLGVVVDIFILIVIGGDRALELE